MNKSNKKLVFLFTKINKKQRTKIHPAITTNKTNRKQVKMSTGKLIRLYYDIILHIIMITITGIILLGGIFLLRLCLMYITN